MNLMLIDDNQFDQMLSKRIVERSGAFEALVQYTDPTQALAHLLDKRAPQPDLVLLDINMPVMDGFEFLEQAEAKLGKDMCPVIIMLTTSLNPSDKKRAMAFDIVKDFLNKPITEATLQEIAKSLRDAG